MLCDDCIYNISKDDFQCSIYEHVKKPRKMSCIAYTDAAHEMPGDMFWDQPTEDYYSYTDEELKRAYPNKWKIVRERIEKIKSANE